jgi:hypothetical protein
LKIYADITYSSQKQLDATDTEVTGDPEQ